MHPIPTVAIFISIAMMADGQSQAFCELVNEPITKIVYTAGSLSGYYNLAKDFIHTTQPKDIPFQKLQDLKDYLDGKDKKSSIMDKVKPLLAYEAGLLALLVIGILYCVLMPLVGSIFFCCRCCGKCGGKRFQQTPVSTSYCIAYVTILAVIFAFMLTGCILYELNNDKAWHEVPKLRRNVVDQLGHVNNFIGNTQLDIVCAIADGFNNIGTQVFQEIGNIPQSISDQIQEKSGYNHFQQLQSQLDQFAAAVKELSSDINATSNAATAFLFNFSNFTEYNALPSGLDTTVVQKEIENFTQYPSVLNQLNITVNHLTAQNNSKSLAQTRSILLENEQDTKCSTDTITRSITDTNNTIQSDVNNFDDESEKIQRNIHDAQGNVSDTFSDDNLNEYSWSRYVLLVFVAPIALILLCTAFGLACGIVGYERSAEPFERSPKSNLGGECLMGAVVLTIIFAWALMVITVFFFVIGFLTETLICEGVFYDQSNKMFDFIQRNWIDDIFDDANFKLNITHLVNTCQLNGTLYQALNVAQVLDLSIIQALVQDIINEIDITAVFQFNANAIYVGDSSELNDLKFTLQYLNDSLLANISFENPTETAKLLQNISNSCALNMDFKNLNESFIYLQANIAAANVSYTNLQNLIANTNEAIDDALQIISQNKTAQQILDEVKASALTTVTNAKGALITYINGFIRKIANETAACGPLYQVYQNIGDIFCKQMMNPVHAVWLSLGWCSMFLIPMVIFAIKLEKYFRRMDRKYYDKIPMSSFLLNPWEIPPHKTIAIPD